MNAVISSLFKFHREKTSSMYLFQMSGFLELRSIISVSTAAMNMLAKDTAFFVPIAVPCVLRKNFPLKWKEFSFKTSLSISLR